MNLKPGTRLGPYEIVSPIEAGGMGSVYKGRDTRLSRDVAIKVPPISALADERLVKRFEREARAAAALLHPNVVAVYDVGQEEFEMPTAFGGETVLLRFLVEEYVEGCSLRKLMRTGRAPVPRIVQIGLGVARGLHAAHEKGLVHRDLKPENILIDRSGHPKIADFGLVRFLYPDSAVPDSGEERAALSSLFDTLTRTGFVVGTLGYMSPEQARGEEVGPASDLFVFGVLLYELLTGSAPFASSNVERAFSAVLKGKIDPLAARAPETPPLLVKVVERCLEKEPRDRYRSAAELLADLESVRRHLADAEQTSPSLVEARPPRSVSPVVWLVGSAAVVLGFAGGFAAGYGRGPILAMPRELLDERRAAFTPTLSSLPAGEASEVVLSADGRLLAFTAPSSDEGTDVLVAPLSGEGAPRPLSDQAGGRAPFFTRDGASLLFSGARPGSEPAIWQAPVDRSTPPVLLVAKGEDPALSPDEKALVLVRRGEKGSALWLAARDGTNLRLLLDAPRHDLRLPVFAGGGSLLVWDVRTQGPGSGGARLVTVDLKAPRLAPFGTARLFAPAGRPVLLPGGEVAALSWEERRIMHLARGSAAVKPLPFGAGLSVVAGSPAGLLTRGAGGPFVVWR